MFRLFCCTLPLILLLQACASSYVAPTPSASTARLRVVEIDGENTTIQKMKAPCLTVEKNAYYSGSHHEKIAYFSAASGSDDLRRLNMPDAPTGKGKFTEIVIDSNQTFHLGYRATRFVSDYPQSMIYNCANGMSFIPAPGADYEAVITRQGNLRCGITLARLTSAEGRVERSPVLGAIPILAVCS